MSSWPEKKFLFFRVTVIATTLFCPNACDELHCCTVVLDLCNDIFIRDILFFSMLPTTAMYIQKLRKTKKDGLLNIRFCRGGVHIFPMYIEIKKKGRSRKLTDCSSVIFII